MTATEHDIKLYWQALEARNDHAEILRLESLCLTEKGKVAIHKLSIDLYHRDEAKAGMI